MVLTDLLIGPACSASSGLTADSILAIISVAAALEGVTSEFKPFFSKDTKLKTHFVLSTKDVGEIEGCFSR